MRKVIAALLAGLLLCAQTPMLPGFPPGTFQNRAALDASGGAAALAFDAQASAHVAASVGLTLSWTHTPVGTPSKVTVQIGNFDGTVTVTTVTYGGNLMTANAASTQSAGGVGTLIYGLLSPPSGAQTVLITFSGTNAFCSGISTTWTGGNGAAVFSAGATGTATTSNPTTTIASAAGEIVVDVIYNNSGATETVAATGQTLIAGPVSIDANNNVYSSQTPGAASVTPNWTQSTSSTWWASAASVK